MERDKAWLLLLPDKLLPLLNIPLLSEKFLPLLSEKLLPLLNSPLLSEKLLSLLSEKPLLLINRLLLLPNKPLPPLNGLLLLLLFASWRRRPQSRPESPDCQHTWSKVPLNKATRVPLGHQRSEKVQEHLQVFLKLRRLARRVSDGPLGGEVLERG